MTRLEIVLVQEVYQLHFKNIECLTENGPEIRSIFTIQIAKLNLESVIVKA